MYDYLTTITPDNDVTLSVDVRGVISEQGSGNVVFHTGDDGSEKRIKLGGHGKRKFFVTLPWSALSESDSGTIMDYFWDSQKGDQGHKSIKWTHHDGHTYVVRFEPEWQRTRELGGYHSIPGITLKVLGNAA